MAGFYGKRLSTNIEDRRNEHAYEGNRPELSSMNDRRRDAVLKKDYSKVTPDEASNEAFGKALTNIKRTRLRKWYD